MITPWENFKNTSIPIDWYIWQIPPGWQIVSSGAYPLGNNRYETASSEIRVIPAKGNGGSTVNQIKVQAYSRNCNFAYNPTNLESYVSKEQVLYIDREPVLGNITASKTNLTCADKSPITFSVPPLTGAAYYTWTLPDGWTVSGPANGNTITVIPSGTGGGQVLAAANFTCTSPIKTVNSKAVVITFNEQVAKPSFTASDSFICTSKTFAVANTPGATGYTWETTGGVLINNLPSPQHNMPAQVTLSAGAYLGAAQVKVYATNSQCQNSEPIIKDVWVGNPQITTPGVYIDYTRDCEQIMGLSVYQAPGASTYVWYANMSMDPDNFSPQNEQLYHDGSNKVEVDVVGIEGYYMRYRAYAKNECGTLVYIGEKIYEARRPRGCFPEGGCDDFICATASPNPSKDRLEINITPDRREGVNLDNISFMLYNSSGFAVKQGAIKNSNAIINTSSLKPGMYYLHIRHAKGAIKQTIIVEQ